jgi:hypothetical protein
MNIKLKNVLGVKEIDDINTRKENLLLKEMVGRKFDNG